MKKIIVLLLFFVVIISIFFNSNTIESFENHTIPKMIWTFWDGDSPDIINKCMSTWKKHNQDYKIILLNKNNINTYLPEIDFSKIKNIENPAHFSDMVRIHILAKNGGIWCDASVICLRSFEWINELQFENNSEFVGFYIDSFTKKEHKEKYPVIENWFFACIKGSQFVCDWRDEYAKITNFDSRKLYIENLKVSNVDFQNIGDNEYLAMHLSAQKVLQSNRKYKLSLIKAEDDAFKYLTQNDWDSKKAVKNIIECKSESKIKGFSCGFLEGKIIKLRGDDRKEIESIEKPYDLFDRF